MKRLGRILVCLFAAVLAVASMQVRAAAPGGDRGFDHAHTGFPIVGVHATTPCESCHVGGVFLGTPRACDGCHAVGRRVVATPKSARHIVTDAPCDTCHFNTSTFYGARYNHGTAVPGQCENCHNGRIMAGKPSGHPVTTYTCDNCHRSSSWVPASWNHRDTASDCVTCHNGTGPGRNYATARHNGAGSYSALGILTPCRECHTNYYTFYSYRYSHTGPGAVATCGNCHANATYATSVTQAVNAIHSSATAVGISACQSCHTGYATFLGARYNHANTYDSAYSTKMAANSCAGCHDGTHTGIRGIPTNHTNAFNAGLVASPTGPNSCNACHTVSSTWAQMNHGALTSGGQPCKSCHDSGLNPNLYFSGMTKKRDGHEGYRQASQDCITCHANQYSSWNDPH